MQQKTIVITGASDGIGAAAARELSSKGWNVIIVGRSPEKTKAVADAINCKYYIADFAKFSDVRQLAALLLHDVPRIDVLANNAGALVGEYKLTEDGHEMTHQVNHLSPFLLTELLMDRLIQSRASVINTSSKGNRLAGHVKVDNLDSAIGYKSLKVYGRTKLLNILFTKELQRRYGSEGISAAAFHPGIVRTSFSLGSGSITGFLYKTFINRFFLTPEQGADTLVWLATSTPGQDWKSGEYYAKRKIASADEQVDDEVLAKKLWEISATSTMGKK